MQVFPMYPEEIVAPMREELTSIGVRELRTVEEVDQVFKHHKGTTLLIINSVCGCAAGSARPAVRMALENEHRPDECVTVFAGVDLEATERARAYIKHYPPSSPSMALFKDGEVVAMLQRHNIEGRMPEQIAQDLIAMFNKFCQ